MEGTYIGQKASIDPTTFIGRNVRVLGNTRIGPNCYIDDSVVIGYPSRQALLEITRRGRVPLDLSDLDNRSDGETIIGSNCCIRFGSIISTDTHMQDRVYCDVRTQIGARCRIGSDTQILYGARIYNDVKVGSHCRIGGFCCDRCLIEDVVSSFGNLIHSYRTPTGGLIEPSPVIRSGATVGWGAIIIGGIEIGRNSYVAAGTVVPRTVPGNCMAIGHGPEVIPRSEWKGALATD